MWRLPFGLLAALILLAVGGCGSTGVTLPPATPAPPQQARVDWVEPTSPTAPRLVFTVRAIDVLPDGWRAVVAIRNDSEVPWAFAHPAVPEASFGLMLFATGELDELERRNGERNLPGVRPARTVVPTPPARLAPGASWEGSISAPGALASGRWVRVVFGPLTADGDPPDGLPTPLLWITDHAHLLRR
jgi:hypothetical protein